MKLKMYFVMLAMGLMSFAMLSCSDDDDSAPVPSELENAFIARFGEVAHDWSTRGTNFIAEFKDRNQDVDAWFDANGNWLMTETDLPFEALPEAVKQSFLAGEYKDWKRDDVDMLERKGMETIYVIEVERGHQEYDLYFDGNGTLLKEVEDVDKEDDSDKYLPTALPDAVTRILAEKYAGYKLLEVEREPGNVLEVDIWLHSTKHEVRFNQANEWISTSREVSYTSLPGVVKTAVDQYQQTHPGELLDDDEADFVETPQGNYYVIELEKGEQDIYLKVSEDGTVLS